MTGNSWAENTRHYSPTLTTTASRRSSSPTDTNHDPDLLPPPSDDESGGPDTLDQDRHDLDDTTYSSREAPSRKGSIYLDAVSDPLSETDNGLNDILRELREIPSSISGQLDPASSLDEEHADTVDDPPVPRVQPNVQDQSISSSSPFNTTAASTSQALGPTSPFRSTRSRTLCHSFSSSTVPSRKRAMAPLNPQGPPPVSDHTDGDAEATVELHEESAAAFQDFLFWAYPHLECKVTWTNVEPVSPRPHTHMSLIKKTSQLTFLLARRTLDQAPGTGSTKYLLCIPTHLCIW